MTYNQDIKYFISRIGQELDLSKTKSKNIKDSYNALSRYINNNHDDTENTDFSVYPTGSYSTKTVVKPLKGDDFDIDMIVEFLKQDYKDVDNARDFYEKLLDVFSGDSQYSDKVVENDHCITIKYENGYHVDIIPAKPISNNSIRIPNRKRNKWVERRPKLYSQWFNEISNKKSKFVYFNEKASINDALFARDRAIEIDELEESDFEEVNVLNRAVQLIKRARDVYFDSKNISKRIPQSIIYTTLCALHYEGEYDILELMEKYSNKFLSLSESRLSVQNPVNNSEYFTEKWPDKKEYQTNFESFSKYFHKQISVLGSSNDSEEIITVLNELFGSSIYSRVKTFLIEEGKKNGLFESRPTNSIKFKDTEVDFEKRKGRGSSE